MSATRLHEPRLEKKDSQTVSLWMATKKMPAYPPLTIDKKTDVCIVGGGMTGLMSAYLLMKEGVRTVVLDDGPLAGGETQRTSAHLSCVFDHGFEAMERLHGHGVQTAAESHRQAIDLIESIIRDEKIECGFERVNGYLFTPPEKAEGLSREFEAAARAGVRAEWVDRLPLDTYNPGRAIRFPAQAQFHPLRFLAAIAGILAKNGCEIFSGTRAESVEGGPSCIVETKNNRVSAGTVIVATNTPFNNQFVPHTKQAAYRTYMLGLRAAPGSTEKALYWDTEDPYHYVRFEKPVGGPRDILLVGGEDHKTGQADDAEARFMRLEAWARKRFPFAGIVEYRWSGQVLETIDHLAFIGRNPEGREGVFIATGDCGMGLTHGAIAGMLLRDLVLDRDNPWEQLYDPARKPVKAAKNFLKENANVVGRYADWLTEGDVRFIENVPRGGGAVLRSGLKKIAVYRDDAGKKHEMTAVCPHLGCIVDWNSTEKTWDCPCHGSRFDCRGKLLNGPSNVDLAPVRTDA